MAIPFLSPIDLGGLEILNVRAQFISFGALPLASNHEGRFLYDSTNQVLRYSNGTSWLDMSGDVRSVTAGDGLTDGGTGGDVTLNVGAGLGITVNANDVQLDIAHARNVDHSITHVYAGDGLTGGGTIDASVTLNVVATTDAGITVTSDAIAFKNYSNLTQYRIMMWGPGGQLENAPITRTVNQASEETITINGNLVVNGTTTTVNSNEVNIGDSIILLNSDLGGSTPATQDGGFSINRGSDPDVSFLWDETNDRFTTVDQKLHVGSVDTIVPGSDDFFYVYDNAIGETGEIKKATFNSVANLLGAPIHYSLDAAQGAVTKSTNTYTVTHNLGTKAVSVQVVDYSTQETVFVDVARPTVNTITVTFASTVVDNDYYVILMASKRSGDTVAPSENGDAPDTQNA